MPRLFELLINTDPVTTKRIAFGEAGLASENITLADFLTWLQDNLTLPAQSQEVADIGNWDMDVTVGVQVPYTPPTGKKVVGMQAFIRPGDAVGTVTDQLKPLNYSDVGTDVAGKIEYSSASNRFDLDRIAGGEFDQISYSGTGFNRGYVVVFITDV